MGSLEVSNDLKVGKTIKFLMGSDTELLSITGQPTKLLVLYREKIDMVHAFRSGNFSVHMVIVNNSNKQISMVNCIVGDHQWMLAKDSVVASLGAGRYVFGLPGFSYGLELPHEGPQQKYAKLEGIFANFCNYHDLSHIEGCNNTNSSTNTWIQAHNTIANLSTTPFSTNNLTKMERAIRTSAIVKLLARSLLTGVLHPSKHIQTGLQNSEIRTVLPTMRIVSDLLNTLETGRANVNREVPDGKWNVNIEGVMVLLRVMRAFGAKMVVCDGKRKRDGMKGGGCGGRSPVEGFGLGTCGNS